MLILDPLLAYIGGDVTRQDVTAKFVRSGLQPAIAKADCGLLLVHHPPKPKKDTGEAKAGEDAYFGAGSADLANWARAVIALKPTTHHGIYELRLAKRGQRAGWPFFWVVGPSLLALAVTGPKRPRPQQTL